VADLGEQRDAVRRTDLQAAHTEVLQSASYASTATARSSGWRSFIAGNSAGKSPAGWRWLGIPALLALCTIGGCWGWGHMESELNERALVHLACEGIDTNDLDLDWSYRSVTVAGVLPAGVSAERIEAVLDRGSDDDSCLANAGIDASTNPGVYGVDVLAAAGIAAAVPGEDTAEPTPVPVPATPTPEPAESTVESGESEVVGIDVQAGFDGQSITLAGTVPSEDQRQILVDAAVRAVGSDNVVDQLRIVSGEPSVDSAVRAGELARVISQFDPSLLAQGTANASDQAVNFDLLAVSEDVRRALDLDGVGTINVAPGAEDDPTTADDSTTGDE